MMGQQSAVSSLHPAPLWETTAEQSAGIMNDCKLIAECCIDI